MSEIEKKPKFLDGDQDDVFFDLPNPLPMLSDGHHLSQPCLPHRLTDYVTPERDLFRVWHLGLPNVDSAKWAVFIHGLVERPCVLTLDTLLSRPQKTVTAFHECAGNPSHPNIPQRRVGNVEWSGVPLVDVLYEAGLRPNAAFVLSKGVDHGIYDGIHHAAYEKDIPLDKALDPNVLLALSINGAPIQADRGGPVRLVVPGFYGTNSTKWLSEITVSDHRSRGAFTTRYYMDRNEDGSSTPVWDVKPNSVIVAPSNAAEIPRTEIEIWGWAWAAEPIVSVDVSTDNGATWGTSELETRQDNGWQKFKLTWIPASVGEYVLLARATDARGNTQTDAPSRNRIHRISIFIRTP